MIRMTAKPVIELKTKILREKTESLVSKLGRPPHLSVVLIGNHPASQVYVSKKGIAAENVGFTHETVSFPENASVAEVRNKVARLNQNPSVDGILIQRPLPKGFSEDEVIFWVSPEKDVDCLHPENIGLLVSGKPRFLPCTPAGVLELLDHYEIPVAGKLACVIGRSAIVGKPLAALLMARNATLLQIHRSTPQPEKLCALADLVFAAAGSREVVKKAWLKPGAVVVDIGIHKDEVSGKLFGDVDFESVKDVVSAISPVPGGVGPMTIQILLENTFTSASQKV